MTFQIIIGHCCVGAAGLIAPRLGQERTTRYSVTKCVAAALAWMAVLGTAAATADTTYFYTGSPYTAINTGLLPCSPSPCTNPPNPNAAADAAVFGTNLTGFITFGIDTTGLTETFNDLFTAPITAAGFASGDIRWGRTFGVGSLTLTNGAITDWNLSLGSGS